MFRRCLTLAAGCIASGLAVCGCYDARFEAPPAESACQAATSSLASLRGGYAGKPFTVEAPVTVTGIVTSSDRAGNFYRSLCIEEDHAALEVMAGIDQLHNDFPVGCRVVLQLEGLDLDKNAVQRIESGQRFVTDIELTAFAQVFHVSLEELIEKNCGDG